MDRISVSSSNIESAGYDLDASVLEVEFTSGAVYQYLDVPQEVFDELMRSSSKGSYFAKNIRDSYRCKRIS